MMRVDDSAPKWSTLLVNVVRDAAHRLLASEKIYDELAFK